MVDFTARAPAIDFSGELFMRLGVVMIDDDFICGYRVAACKVSFCAARIERRESREVNGVVRT